MAEDRNNVDTKMIIATEMFEPYNAALWLVRINDQPRVIEVLLAEQVGCSEADAADIFITSIDDLVEISSVKFDWHDHNAEADEATQKCEVYVGQTMSPRITRKSSRLMKATPNHRHLPIQWS
jgi:hypothetical protein